MAPAALAALAALPLPAHGQGEGSSGDGPATARANDPIAIAGSPPPVARDATSDPGTAARPDEDTASLPAPPARESTPLGLPNGPLGARPVPRDAASEPGGGAATTWLDRLDPRRSEVTRVLGALTVVIGLLLLVRLALRRAASAGGGAGRPSGIVEILARYPVSRGQHLVLLKVARRVLLVHQSGATMTTLSEMTDPQEVAGLLGRVEAGSRGRQAARFRSMLRRHEAEYDAPPVPVAATRPRRDGDPQIVDLTHRRGAGRRLLARGVRA